MLSLNNSIILSLIFKNLINKNHHIFYYYYYYYYDCYYYINLKVKIAQENADERDAAKWAESKKRWEASGKKAVYDAKKAAST